LREFAQSVARFRAASMAVINGNLAARAWLTAENGPWHIHCLTGKRMLTGKTLWLVVALIGVVVFILSAAVIFISTSPH
jgi:hypothetical protein